MKKLWTLLHFFGVGLDRKFGPRPARAASLNETLWPVPDRQRRKAINEDWRLWRRTAQRLGPPVLTGARLARVADACSPKHLTILSRGARRYWGLA